MDRVGHDVAWVHRLLQVRRDALQRHRVVAAAQPPAAPALAAAHRQRGVQRAREGEAQRDRRQRHLDADQQVLVAGRDGADTDHLDALLRVGRLERPGALHDRQHHACAQRDRRVGAIFLVTSYCFLRYSLEHLMEILIFK